ncbi:hypothetical protein ACFL20_11405 [Spirochaetota bacterium]
MLRIKSIIIIILTFILSCPTLLLATRGKDDYGLAMVIMFILYSLPVGILLICFIIYSTIKLNKSDKPTKKQGKIIFILSNIIIAPTIIIPLLWIIRADWKSEMIEVMTGTFVPILVLTIISSVLAKLVKKKSLMSDSEFNDAIAAKSEKAGAVNEKFLQYVKIGLVFISLILIALLFKYCFT